MRLPNTEFTSRPWRAHEITGDFVIEDVWALPTPGGPDDLDRLVRQLTDGDDSTMSVSSNVVVGTLWALRLKIGALLRWDTPDKAIGHRVASLCDRLPQDLRAVRGPDMEGAPFTSVFLTHDEWLAEFANSTVHCLLHLGWVEDGHGGYHGQMTALVKPSGLFGKLYMAMISPLRQRVVYPHFFREMGKTWRAGELTDTR
ncbi:DUF2867 domain-containing protein [Nocardia sp. NPDC050406]|uniref:DUF2867 domain-containing protein n=1 Tax=Nocardia sp. NPDC050406 TaxID=3364318 RepID=UPI003790FEFD